jgi:hypothetical protein
VQVRTSSIVNVVYYVFLMYSHQGGAMLVRTDKSKQLPSRLANLGAKAGRRKTDSFTRNPSLTDSCTRYLIPVLVTRPLLGRQAASPILENVPIARPVSYTGCAICLSRAP